MAGVYGLTGGLAPRSLPPLSEPRPPTAAATAASPDAANASSSAPRQDTAVFSDAARQAAEKDKDEAEKAGELDEKQQKEVERLKERDREVRQHEQAHAAAAGRYAKGGPQYEFTRGPDGRQYATGGEVSIDTSPASSPEATISKMQQVRRAALAPAEPSPQDRRVAAEASAAEIKARQALAKSRAENSGAEPPEASEAAGTNEAAERSESGGIAGAPAPAADTTARATDPNGNALSRILNSFTGAGATAGRLDAQA